MTDDVGALLARGDYAAAAAAARHRGGADDLAQAEQLYARIWDFRSAAETARERGDRPAAVRHLIDARDAAGARLLLRQIAEAGEDHRAEQEAAAQVCEGRRLWEDAAGLRERIGDLARARELMEKAQLPLEVGRLCERLGDLRAAGAAYEQHLQQVDVPAGERVRAGLGLGRVLLGFGKPLEAARVVQAARREVIAAEALAPHLDDIDRLLIYALVDLGRSGAAEHALRRYYKRRGEAAPALGAFLQGPRPGASAPDERVVLLSRYEIDRLLGAGGMGRVYLARDRLLGRSVALKLVPRPATSQRQQGEAFARFVREAQIVRGLRHPNIVEIIDFHEGEGLLAMEYVAGGTLAERPLPLPLALTRRLLLQVLDALAAAHARGVVHRDVKPPNILLTLTADAKLGDFGVAHLQDLAQTQTAGFVGTLAYMAPEQILGTSLSFATDIYALGVTAFQLVTGRLPFSGPDFVGQHLEQPAPRPSSVRVDLPAAWDALCATALAKDPRQRFESLGQMRAAVLALPIERSLRDDAPEAPSQRSGEAAPASAGEGEGPPYRVDAPCGETAHSTLHLGHDLRLGRPVIVERFRPGALAGAQHAWLQQLARAAQPGLQRVLRIHLEQDTVVYEAPLGPALVPPLTAAERRRLVALLGVLAERGVVHGGLRGALLREAHGLLLLIQGRGPLHGAATLQADQRDLADLLAAP